MSSRKRNAVIAVVATDLVGTILARFRGYQIGTNTIVRCRRGHLFTTIWIPGVSLKSLRFGWWRFQRCPVGHHWTLVAPVKEAELSEEEKRFAAEHKDIRIP